MTESVELFCTVITGFEKVAAKEIAQKLPARNVEWSRGNVRFFIDLNLISLTLKLRSVDNLYAVFYENQVEGLQRMSKMEAIAEIQKQISFCNWKLAVEAWQTMNGKKSSGGSERVVEQMKQFIQEGKETEVSDESPTFRVTCKRCGEKSMHQFTSMDAASKFGAQINNVFGWKCSVKEFDMEVVLRIERDQMTVMMALNRESLFKRNICAYGPTTMRSTMCFCMLSLADVHPGDIVVDPMCGGGSIPIEGAMAWSDAFFVGGDHHELAMERCRQNWPIDSPANQSNCEFVQWDATNLPFPDSSVDAIVTDLPFGKKIGSTTDNRLLYPRLIGEWKRVLKKGGRLVVMTHDKRSLENSILKDRSSWRNDASHIVNVGGLNCLCLRITNVKNV
uniref:THUMP domain-containing protein n=1 Tax=Caenorhabditis japonica TaxID=281687 RepID=A0A8R1DH43_CAEJA